MCCRHVLARQQNEQASSMHSSVVKARAAVMTAARTAVTAALSWEWGLAAALSSHSRRSRELAICGDGGGDGGGGGGGDGGGDGGGGGWSQQKSPS